MYNVLHGTSPQGDIIVLEDHNHCIVPLAHDEVGGIKNIAWNSIPPVTASAFFSHYDDNAKQEVSYIVTAVLDEGFFMYTPL